MGMDRRRFLGVVASSTAAIGGDNRTQAQPLSPITPANGLSASGGLGRPNIGTAELTRAIDRAMGYLKSMQLINGTWQDQPHYDGGLTPLCTLALVSAGCKATDPVVRRALDRLGAQKPFGTYSVALETMLWCEVDPHGSLPLIRRNVQWLESRQHTEGDKRGMWAVPDSVSMDHTDNSMTHLAMLALYEAERTGVAVNQRTWAYGLEHWRGTQNGDGGWGWGPSYPGTGSMTCAGLACVVAAKRALGLLDATVENDRIVGCRSQPHDPTIAKAQNWLAQSFSPSHNPSTDNWLSYYYAALEQLGRMNAQRFIGIHDWFRETTVQLVSTQESMGAWTPDLGHGDVSDKKVSTSFNLMFLAKGRLPSLVTHLVHPQNRDWNPHCSALHNLVYHAGRAWERTFTHQVLDLQQASVEQLLESPLVFINGHDSLRLSSGEKKKLQMYIERGGFLLAENCCRGAGFDRDFRALMRELYPTGEHDLHPLPASHPVWHLGHRVDPTWAPALWGVHVNCRTAVIYSEDNLSACWELDGWPHLRSEYASASQQIETARHVGLNLLEFVTNREAADKNPSLATIDSGVLPADSAQRGKLYLANVLHPGGCHGAPASLRHLLRRAAEQHHLEISLIPSEVRLNDDQMFRYHLVQFHGQRAFELTGLERTRLRQYVERGGLILADAICSNEQFTTSFRREMETIFPGQPLEPIPPSHPIFSSDFGGTRLRRLSLRRRQPGPSAGGPALQQVNSPPLLESLVVHGRHAVIFSRYDISCGLEAESLECEGYARKDALALAMNILLYSLAP